MEQTPRTFVVFASPHPDGHTARLLQAHLHSRGITDVAMFNCFATPVSPCVDCGRCKTEFSCQYGDLDAFLEHFAACRQVIFAFPVYNAGVPAPLKALLDRFQIFYNARFHLGHQKGAMPQKQATLLYTCGSKDVYRQQLQATFAPMFTVMDTLLTEIISKENTDKE